MASLTEREVSASGGTRLHVRQWEAEVPRVASLLVLHGYMDHSGRYDEVAAALADAGIAVTIPDQRGHGRSEGRRGYTDAFSRYLDDAARLLEPLPQPRFLLGHSFGGLVALDFVGERKPSVRGLILSNPYLDTALAVPGWKIAAGNFLGKVAPWISLPSGLETEMLTRDPEMQRRHREDKLVFLQANAGWYREAMVAQARARAMRRLDVPLLMVLGDADPVASASASRALFAALECGDKVLHEVPGGLHEVLFDLGREALFPMLAGWMRERV